MFWQEPEGEERFLTDRYRRPLAQVKEELGLALDLAERLSAIVAAVETRLTAGNTFGPSLPRRLQSSITTLTRVVERDNRTVAALEQAWQEEQEKQAQWEQEKRGKP